MEKETKEAQMEFFKDLENATHERLMKLPESVAFLLFQKLLGLLRSGERKRSWQLFFDWLANKKSAEEIAKELETQDE